MKQNIERESYKIKKQSAVYTAVGVRKRTKFIHLKAIFYSLCFDFENTAEEEGRIIRFLFTS